MGREIKEKLCLFRVGGVLVRTKTANLQRAAFTSAFNEVFSSDLVLSQLPHDSGKTVLALLDEVMMQQGISVNGKGSTEMMESLDRHFAQLTTAKSTTSDEAFPGAESLLGRLQDAGAVMGALSSGTPYIAHRQLALAGLASYFSDVGGYGSQHESRTDLVSLALENAQEKFGHDFSRLNTIVVGATTHDVYAARACGVPAFAVSVNPAYPAKELEAAGAEMVVASLQELADCKEFFA
jgi:phosphoglycolate phosphatase-like HAD superfamily hydrolase